MEPSFGRTPHDSAIQDRRRRILEVVRGASSTPVTGLFAQIDASDETVRRDLRALEAQGLLERSYGVVRPVMSGAHESSLGYREANGVEEKRRIATAVADLLGDAGTVFLDEGFQMALIADEVARRGPMTVVTPSIAVAQRFTHAETVEVLVLGGRLRPKTLGLVGSWTERMLADLSIDVAVVGANGIDNAGNLTTPDPAVAAVKASALRASRRHLFAGAHHKFGVSTFMRFAVVTDFEQLVTGRELRPGLQNRYATLGATLRCI